MQPRQRRRTRRSDDEPTYQPLPPPLAFGLGPEARRALMHGMRRCILRTLNRAQVPRTTGDLLTTFPEATLKTVAYHVCVLEDCEALAVSHVEQTRGGLTRSFVSSVAGDAQIIAILRATERMDDAR
jgi:hypothetical protein